ncbi:unnamed protein product [Closterium sp. Yama58-4]|nr:unnamed protein product [Closterium sp. Yama58-4]
MTCLFVRCPSLTTPISSTRAPAACAAAIGPSRKCPGAVLEELQSAWKINFTNWGPGWDCRVAAGLTCDQAGSVTSMQFSRLMTPSFPTVNVTRLTRLTELSFYGVIDFPYNPLYSITWLKSLSVECVPGGVAETFPSTISNLAQLTRLRVKDCGMGTNGAFSVLSSLTSLVDVELPSNGVSDLSPLQGLDYAKLQQLYDSPSFVF